MRYFDAHVHVCLHDEGGSAGLANGLARSGIGIFHCGLDPRSWETDVRRLGRVPDVFVGAGLHPWWVHADVDGPSGARRCGDAEAELLERLCGETRLIGEVGLDFGRKTTEERRHHQLRFFERVCRAAAAASVETGVPRVLSIHSVRAAGTVIDVLGRTGALDRCRCVFHWFSGTTDELWRAIRAGCWFSMNEMGLATGKGREYARLVPAGRLLIETDHESFLDEDAAVERLEASLAHAVELMAEARGVEASTIRELTVANARALLY